MCRTGLSHDDAISCLDGSWSAGTQSAAAAAVAAAASSGAAGKAPALHQPPAPASAPPMLVSGSWDSTVRIWPLLPHGLSPAPLRTLGEHDARVLCVSLLPADPRLCASGGRFGGVPQSVCGSVLKSVQISACSEPSASQMQIPTWLIGESFGPAKGPGYPKMTRNRLATSRKVY